MTQIFDPIVREVESLVSDQLTHVKVEKAKAGKVQLVKVRPQLPRDSSDLISEELSTAY